MEQVVRLSSSSPFGANSSDSHVLDTGSDHFAIDASASSGNDSQFSSDTPQLVLTVLYPRGATIFAAACCILFVIVGTIGNSVTVLALSRCVKLRNNATTAFVISLSVADLLFCIFNLPLTASRYIYEDWVLGDTLCVLFPFLFYGNVGVSLISMTAITINRYILIAHYQWYDRIYQRLNIILMIAFVWAFSFAILVPTLLGSWGQFGYSPETFSCTILRKGGKSPKKFLFLFGFLLPCIVIVISYSCIFYKVRQSRHNVAAHGSKSPSNGARTNGVNSPGGKSSQWCEDLRLTRLMLIIFCTFIICYLPLMIANVFIPENEHPVLHVLASVLAYASSCINPFIYAFHNRQYRNAYCRVLCCFRQGFTGSTGRQTVSSHSNSRSNSGMGKTMATDVYQYNVVSNKMQPLSLKTNGDAESYIPINQ